MNKEELIKKLKTCYTGNLENDHIRADEFLLEYIDDEEVDEVYDNIDKWYA